MDGYAGPARALVDGRDVGQWRVELEPLADDRDERSWGGRVANSDYVLWGLAGRRLELVLPSGHRAACVVRPTGEIIGLGPAPF
ncbi:MAG: hypothetical protein HKN26_10830 [Acidimicrobiales bacterium]|nr:hypothetical protein [Acidimicrobiales bacterium]